MKLTGLDGTSLIVIDSEEGVDILPLIGSNGSAYYFGEYAGVKAWALENSLFIEYQVDGEFLADSESSLSMLPIHKAQAVRAVEEYAEGMRSVFTENAAKGLLSTYQLNSEILNLLDAGVAYSDLDAQLKAKIDIEVATDKRYTTAEQLIAVWRVKRGQLAIASAWVAAIENNTLATVNAATTKAEIDRALAEAKTTAEEKSKELTS